MADKIKRSDLELIEFAFRTTWAQNGTEDRVLIYRNADTGKVVVLRPDMVRTRAAVVGDVPLNFEKGGQIWDLVYDLHSHHTMGCFFSPTDDRDETKRGVVFGVFSWRDSPTWHFRRWRGPEGGFQGLSFTEVVDCG